MEGGSPSICEQVVYHFLHMFSFSKLQAYIVCVCLSFQVRKGMARIKVVLGERVSSLIFIHVHVHVHVALGMCID